MIVNGVNLPDPDVGDLEFLEKYESANYVIVKQSSEIDKFLRRSEAVRIQCNLVFDFFNTVFGEGTAKKIFGERVNLKTCIDAYEEAVNGINALDAKLGNYFRSKGTNHGQRRNKKRKKKRKK